MSAPAAALERDLRRHAADIRVNEPLHRHVSLRVGGPADILAVPRSARELKGLAQFLFDHEVSFLVLGQGSNVLVADAGIRGVVVKVGKGVDRLDRAGDRVIVEAGRGLPHLARHAARLGLSGLEFAAGIPATVGGAAVMNAGAHGHAMSDVVEEVRIITEAGEATIAAEALSFRYRTSALQAQRAVVAAVSLRLRPADPTAVVRTMEEWLARRNATQPIGPPSSGCIFRNPDGDHAGRLIEAAGLKSLAVGDAVVSEIHANYIINRGKASAADVLALVDTVRGRVRQASGRELELEVKVLGARA